MKYHHGNLKEELITSACKICEAEGHENMSLRSIAKEANVSQTAPCLLYTSPSPRDS